MFRDLFVLALMSKGDNAQEEHGHISQAAHYTNVGEAKGQVTGPFVFQTLLWYPRGDLHILPERTSECLELFRACRTHREEEVWAGKQK